MILTEYYKNMFSVKRQVKARFVVDSRGICNGAYTLYYRNGNPAEEGTKVNGVAEGKIIKYHENGHISEISQVVHGRPVGRQFSYWPDGSQRCDYTCRNNHLVGEALTFQVGGALRSQDFYDETGALHGLCKSWGQGTYEESFFVHGVRTWSRELTTGAQSVQKYFVYDKSGFPTEERFYQPDGSCRRVRYAVSELGNDRRITDECWFDKKNRLDKDYIEYDSTGHIARRTTYHAGQEVVNPLMKRLLTESTSVCRSPARSTPRLAHSSCPFDKPKVRV